MSKDLIAKFQAELSEDGFEVATKTMDPSAEVSDHTHDFDVRGLVTGGEFSITVDGKTERYGSGDRFTLAAGCVHRESVGPDGVSFIVGRRHR